MQLLRVESLTMILKCPFSRVDAQQNPSQVLGVSVVFFKCDLTDFAVCVVVLGFFLTHVGRVVLYPEDSSWSIPLLTVSQSLQSSASSIISEQGFSRKTKQTFKFPGM